MASAIIGLGCRELEDGLYCTGARDVKESLCAVTIESKCEDISSLLV